MRRCKNIEKLRKKSIVRFLACMMFIALLGGGAFYSQYYQSTHLNQDDSTALLQGYVLVKELEVQFDKIPETDNSEKVGATIDDLSGRLASYGVRIASSRLGEEAQSSLNRLYQKMKEFGVNTTGQPFDSLKNAENYDSYKSDLNAMKNIQKKIFKQFNIQESSIK
ncbi:hypothetical protein RV18_GL000717 [Enterococcus termitis]|nr:hypothetical protein RV18_GL000717 [Enterococcus termitis]